MDNQPLFNLIVGIAGAVGGWMLKLIWDAIRDLKRDVQDISREMHSEFVRRDDFTAAVERIEAMVARIFDKLDGKQDK